MESFRKVIRLYHTMKVLKIRQIIYRFWFLKYNPSIDQSPHPGRRIVSKKWVLPIVKPPHLHHPWEFSFLNFTRACTFPADWNNASIEKLWLYNLHYFDDLQGEKAAGRQGLHSELLLKWIAENPPGFGNGWEPYPISLRIVNLVKWVLAGNACPELVVQSMAVQARFLGKRLEYHLLGNHLFANAKALVFAGLFFGGKEGDEWLRRGMAILEREVPEQILDDGGHFERSPMYHCIILEDMLDMVNLFQAYGREYPALWREKIPAMLGWLAAMVHPDGQIALFNDAAVDIAAPPAKVFGYAARLGFAGLGGGAQAGGGLKRLKASGYIRLQSEAAVMLLDVGEIGPEYLPGHAHADTLSFEMSVFGKRLIVDSGTSCYGLSAERLRQRGTAAHNTVTVEDEDSSEVWSGFRVARRARPFGLFVGEGERMTVRCSHDGYRRLKGKVVHTRCWEMAEREVVVTDCLAGEFAKACGQLHFHPDVQVAELGAGRFAASFAGGKVVRIEVLGGVAEMVDASYHPEFGVQVKNTCIRTRFDGKECVTRMSW